MSSGIIRRPVGGRRFKYLEKLADNKAEWNDNPQAAYAFNSVSRAAEFIKAHKQCLGPDDEAVESKRDGGTCPYCTHPGVRNVGTEVDALSQVIIDRTCLNCNVVWQESYTYSDFMHTATIK